MLFFSVGFVNEILRCTIKLRILLTIKINSFFFSSITKKIPCSSVCTFDRELFTRARVGVTQKTEWINLLFFKICLTCINPNIN